MNKEQFIKIVLEKRFGETSPQNIPCLLEINTYTPADNSESPMGLGVQLVLNEGKEDYQVSPDGIVYSWGNAPVIDDRSLNRELT